MKLEELYQAFIASEGVTTDSRQDVNGKVFFALQGPNFDGHHYVSNVLERGAVLAVVEDNSLIELSDKVVCFPDSLKALQDLANLHRRTLNTKVVAITGSNGKTTTKELATAVLSKKYNLHATKGNFNNLLGLPLTLLAAKKDHDLILLEMGTNAKGEIEALCQIAEPDIGLITNVGAAHLEGFGDIDHVLVEKTSLYRSVMKRGGLILVPEADENLMHYTRNVEHKLTYGIAERHRFDESTCLIQIEHSVPEIQGSFMANEEVHMFNSTLMGTYNGVNCSAAIALGLSLSVDPAGIADAIGHYQSVNNRSQVVPLKGGHVLLDAYNANPSSMSGALDVLAQWPSDKKMVILGDMKELGERSVEFHQALIERVSNMDLTQAFFVGSEMSLLKEDAFTDVFHLIEHLKAHELQMSHTILLIKGSRSIQLEKILEHLSIDLQQVK